MNWNEEVEAAFQDAHFEEEEIDGLEYEDGFIDGVIRGSEWQRYRLRMPVSIERAAVIEFTKAYGDGRGATLWEDVREEVRDYYRNEARNYTNALLGED